MRNLLTALAILLVPFGPLRRAVLRSLGHSVGEAAAVGLVILWNGRLQLGPRSRIRSFCYLNGVNVSLGEQAVIGALNVFRGAFDVVLGRGARIGRLCHFTNGGMAVIPERSRFVLGERSNVTSGHHFDMCASIDIGRGSVVGGRGSSLWTHGFVHFDAGAVRLINISGIVIGNGVYIGGNSTISPGTVIGDDINVGASSSVAGELATPGLYVSERLRHIPLGSYEEFKRDRVVDEDYKTGNPRITKEPK